MLNLLYCGVILEFETILNEFLLCFASHSKILS